MEDFPVSVINEDFSRSGDQRLSADEYGAIRATVDAIGLKGRSFYSINDVDDAQIYSLFELGRLLERWNQSSIGLLTGNVMLTLFFQPSTRTRLSFETAMLRLGGSVLTEANPLVTSSAAKEESLSDMLRVVSSYANIIVLRHPDSDEARGSAPSAEVPIVNGGWGRWEHPSQALLDLYTFHRTFGRIEGLKVCVGGADLSEARTGHSITQGLARLGAKVTLASPKSKRTPAAVLRPLSVLGNPPVEEFDLSQDAFNDLVSEMDLVYLPGCSAPKGPESEAFKKIMEDYSVRYETLEKIQQDQERTIYITHPLPRRVGEIDARIDSLPNQLYFKSIAHSVSIRMALLASILGV